MPIEYDNNNFLTLNILAEGRFYGNKLPNIFEYVNSLNEPPYAISHVNSWGCYTNSNQFAGTYVANSENTFGVILGHEFNPFIYRGENKEYDNFVPSALRYNFSNAGIQLKHCVDFVKKQEFIELFKKTPYYARCENFTVLNCKFRFDLEAIAQHYEFISNYLDITKDFLTALFFAYTFTENGIYYPITDFNKYTPTLYIGNLKTIYEKEPDNLKIIGFQSLLRPYLQRAMAIEIKKEDTIKPLFEKIILPQSPAISQEIFSLFNNGDKLFPKDYITKASKEIKANKALQEEFFIKYCTKFDLNIDETQKQLELQGYSITKASWDIPEQAKYMINREIDDNIIPFLDSSIGLRGVCAPLYPANNVENKIHDIYANT